MCTLILFLVLSYYQKLLHFLYYKHWVTIAFIFSLPRALVLSPIPSMYKQMPVKEAPRWKTEHELYLMSFRLKKTKNTERELSGEKGPSPIPLGPVYLPESWLGGYHNTAGAICRLWLGGLPGQTVPGLRFGLPAPSQLPRLHFSLSFFRTSFLGYNSHTSYNLPLKYIIQWF